MLQVFAMVWIILDSVYAHAKKYATRLEKDFFQKYDDDLLDYCMHRELVICPTCRTAYCVDCLEEQFETEWVCACCGQKFEETPTHTIKRGR